MNEDVTSHVRRNTLRIETLERPGWHAAALRVPEVGECVHCIEGQAEVVRVLGKVGDGSRLLELRLHHRPKVPFFAAASNVLQQDDPLQG